MSDEKVATSEDLVRATELFAGIGMMAAAGYIAGSPHIEEPERTGLVVALQHMACDEEACRKLASMARLAINNDAPNLPQIVFEAVRKASAEAHATAAAVIGAHLKSRGTPS